MHTVKKDIVLTCKCGSKNLTEVPSGENSLAYACEDCGWGVMIVYLPPLEDF